MQCSITVDPSLNITNTHFVHQLSIPRVEIDVNDMFASILFIRRPCLGVVVIQFWMGVLYGLSSVLIGLHESYYIHP